MFDGVVTLVGDGQATIDALLLVAIRPIRQTVQRVQIVDAEVLLLRAGERSSFVIGALGDGWFVLRDPFRLNVAAELNPARIVRRGLSGRVNAVVADDEVPDRTVAVVFVPQTLDCTSGCAGACERPIHC